MPEYVYVAVSAMAFMIGLAALGVVVMLVVTFLEESLYFRGRRTSRHAGKER